jgi:hypothetical protein
MIGKLRDFAEKGHFFPVAHLVLSHFREVEPKPARNCLDRSVDPRSIARAVLDLLSAFEGAAR